MHRYGRHGARAWLKWRKRHFKFLSSVPVPVNRKLVVFHIHIPTEAERVLVVLDQPDERQEVTIMSNFPTIQHLPEPDEYKQVKTAAKRRAEADAEELQRQSGSIVAIDWKSLESYVKGKAEDFFADHTSLPDDSKESVLQVYWNTYRQHFSANGLPTLDDERDKQLFQLAKQDSNNPPSARNDGRVAFHKEHGYIIRALEVMGIISEGVYEQLDRGDIHDKADKYSFFYQNHERMVVWPDDTFRRWS